MEQSISNKYSRNIFQKNFMQLFSYKKRKRKWQRVIWVLWDYLKLRRLRLVKIASSDSIFGPNNVLFLFFLTLQRSILLENYVRFLEIELYFKVLFLHDTCDNPHFWFAIASNSLHWRNLIINLRYFKRPPYQKNFLAAASFWFI